MYRTAIVQAARPIASRRLLTTSARLLAGGDAGSGSSRSTGARGGDAFTKRESAAEEKYIREEERNRLLQIKERLKQQQQHIEELQKHIDDVTKEGSK